MARTRLSLLLALALAALALPALAPPSDLAPGASWAKEEPPGAKSPWTFDVRVVRVHADPVKGLLPAPWEGTDPVIDGTWAERLAALHARGPVDLLMDQRVSCLDGQEASAVTDASLPISRFDNVTGGQGETRRFDRVQRGVQVLLRPVGQLVYSIRVRWLHWPARGDVAPTGSTEWKGSLALLPNGRTLALVSREHILNAKGESELAEIYCFITAYRGGR